MNDLDLRNGFDATAGRFLWHGESATAIVADLHLGAEAELTRRGIYMPDVSAEALAKAWGGLVARGPRRVVMAGDLFDVAAPDREAQAAAVGLVRGLPAGCETVLLLGNHDPAEEAMREIFRGVAVRFGRAAMVGGYDVMHGDHVERRSLGGKGLIVGHQHPAVVLRDRVRSAKMICYAVCPPPAVAGMKGPLIVLPSFSRAPLGSNLLTGRHWIVDVPRPAAVRILGIVQAKSGAARVLDFGPLEGLRS